LAYVLLLQISVVVIAIAALALFLGAEIVNENGKKRRKFRWRNVGLSLWTAWALFTLGTALTTREGLQLYNSTNPKTWHYIPYAIFNFFTPVLWGNWPILTLLPTLLCLLAGEWLGKRIRWAAVRVAFNLTVLALLTALIDIMVWGHWMSYTTLELAFADVPRANTANKTSDKGPSVPAWPSSKMLILRQIGSYTPEDPILTWVVPGPGKSPYPSYAVKYVRPPISDEEIPPPYVQVVVDDYPDASSAEYGLIHDREELGWVNPQRTVLFGSQLYIVLHAEKAGNPGTYRWKSENRVLSVYFISADPAVILQSYLQKYRAPPADLAP